MKIIKLFFVTLCFFLATYPLISMAQTTEAEGEHGVPQDEFLPPTYENLSKLYWRLGMLDIGDTKNIDNYLLINECGLYKKYIHNEFEWAKVRRATAESITKNMQIYPVTFEAIVPIFLGTYDVEKEKFSVLDQSNVKLLKKIALLYNIKREFECKRLVKVKGANIQGYPRNITVVLNRPMSLKEIPVKKQLAELYISDSIDYYNRLPANYRDVKYQRVAYLRLRLEIIHSLNKEEKTGTMSGTSAVVIGRVVGYEVYADAKKQKPLYAEDFKLKKIRKRIGASPSSDKTGAGGQQPPSSGGTTGASSVSDQATVPATVPSDTVPAPTPEPTPEPTNATSGDTPAADHQ